MGLLEKDLVCVRSLPCVASHVANAKYTQVRQSHTGDPKSGNDSLKCTRTDTHQLTHTHTHTN